MMLLPGHSHPWPWAATLGTTVRSLLKSQAVLRVSASRPEEPRKPPKPCDRPVGVEAGSARGPSQWPRRGSQQPQQTGSPAPGEGELWPCPRDPDLQAVSAVRGHQSAAPCSGSHGNGESSSRSGSQRSLEEPRQDRASRGSLGAVSLGTAFSGCRGWTDGQQASARLRPAHTEEARSRGRRPGSRCPGGAGRGSAGGGQERQGSSRRRARLRLGLEVRGSPVTQARGKGGARERPLDSGRGQGCRQSRDLPARGHGDSWTPREAARSLCGRARAWARPADRG